MLRYCDGARPREHMADGGASPLGSWPSIAYPGRSPQPARKTTIMAYLLRRRESGPMTRSWLLSSVARPLASSPHEVVDADMASGGRVSHRSDLYEGASQAHRCQRAMFYGVSRRGWLAAAWAAPLARLPGPCPLCGERAYGGSLCPACTDALRDSVTAAGPRCLRCCAPLHSPNSSEQANNPDASQYANSAGSREHADCPDCASFRPAPAFDRVIAAFDYADPGDMLIHQYKSAGRFAMAPMLAGLLADAVRAANPPLAAATILVPVPARRTAILRRGFHPAGELARYLGRQCAWPVKSQWLRRTREGARQATLTRPERLRAAEGLYACTRPLAGATVAVVDDVLTTGGTLHAAAQALKAAGAASVTGLVLARTPRGRTPLSSLHQSG